MRNEILVRYPVHYVSFRKLSLEDRITVSSHAKRSSYDETNTKRILNPSPEEDGYKASSLPRSVKISTSSTTTDSTASRDKKHNAETKKETGKGWVWYRVVSDLNVAFICCC